jgi:hypothetical protein
VAACCVLQNRDYEDEDYVAGGGGVTIKSGRMGDKRLGGMPGAGGGMPRSSSDMSLAATHAGLDPRGLNKRLKNQMAPKPGEPGQPRCVILRVLRLPVIWAADLCTGDGAWSFGRVHLCASPVLHVRVRQSPGGVSLCALLQDAWAAGPAAQRAAACARHCAAALLGLRR